MGSIKTRKTILAVDDQPVNLTTIRDILQANNEYEICGVKSGADALRALESNPVDLMLLDIEMPEMSGFELLAEIRKNSFHEKIPAIFVTATASTEIIEQAIEMGAKGYIVKPIKAGTLIKKVNGIFNNPDGNSSEVELLLSRVSLIKEECVNTNLNRAEELVRKLQSNHYTKAIISLSLNRITSALHNEDSQMAAKIAEELINSFAPKDDE